MPQNTITATMGMDTSDAKKNIRELPDEVKNALNQATSHTKSFSSDFSRIFRAGEPGERRFHSLIGSMVRDLSSMQGGATGAAQAMESFFSRISVGPGPGAVLVAIGAAMVTLVRRGEELEKVNSEIAKQSQEMGHALKLATAADGFTALTEKAREFHKEQRKAADEARKEEKFPGRTQAERTLLYQFRHPFATEAEVDKAVAKQTGEARKEAAKQAEIVAKFDQLSVDAQQKQAELARAQVSGSAEEVANLKLQLEYIQKRAEIDVLAQRNPQAAAAAGAALEQEFAQRRKLIEAQAQAAEREFRSKMIQGQFTQQQAALEGKVVDIQNSALSANEKQLAIARERVEIAGSQVDAAEAEVRAAQEQLQAAQSLTEEDRRQATVQLQSAQTREIQARNAVRQAAGGVAEERARQLEAAGREEELTPEEKRKQYQEREKQYEGLIRAAARRRERTDLIDPPKFGDAEYDPLRKYKEAASREESDRARRAATPPPGVQSQIELNKALMEAGKAPSEKTAPAGAMLPEGALEKLQPAQREKVESKIPVMRVIGVSGGTPVTVVISGKQPGDDGPGKPQPSPQAPGAPQPAAPPTPRPSPQAPAAPQSQGQAPSQPSAAPSAGTFSATSPEGDQYTMNLPVSAADVSAASQQTGAGGGYGMKAFTAQKAFESPENQRALQEAQKKKIAAITPETYKEQGIDTNQSMANVDLNKVAEIQSNKDAQAAYFNNPDVQAGFQAQAAMGKEKPLSSKELKEHQAANKAAREKGIGETREDEARKKKDWQEHMADWKRGQEGLPTVSLQPQPGQPQAFPPPAVPQPLPPQPQAPQTEQPPAAPTGQPGGDAKAIVQAIKEAIQQVMEKYWR